MIARSAWIRRIGLSLLVVALLLALVFALMRSGPLSPIRVTVVQAAEGRLEAELFGIGVVEARRSVAIGPTVAGRVRAVAVDVGETVQAGQVLAEMDPIDLDERSAALDASIARAGSGVLAAQAQRRDAQARQALAQVNARRYQALGEQNFISSGAVEARLQELASANANVEAADANLAAAQQDQRRLAAERAGLNQQRDKLRLLAPLAGLVVARDAEPGSTVVAGQAVLRVIDPASMWVRLRLDQGRSAGLVAGLPARIVLRSRPGLVSAGRVSRVEALSDSVTEERVAQVSFDVLPAGLSVGELAEVTLALPPAATTLLLPNASLKRRQGELGVWRIEADGLRFVPVRIGQAGLDGRVQVLDGIAGGDRIVVHSEKDLGAGSRIRIVDALAGLRP